MKIAQWTAKAIAILALVSTPVFAGEQHDHTTDAGHHSEMSRYDFVAEPGEVMIFRDPVSFTGEVVETSNSHRTLRAANGMTIKVPVQALFWNGDTQTFRQSTEIGDRVVVHLRQEEPYRIMQTPSVEEPMLAIGSYDGVFYLSSDFIADLDLDNLDGDIYADSESEPEYDIDLATTEK